MFNFLKRTKQKNAAGNTKPVLSSSLKHSLLSLEPRLMFDAAAAATAAEVASEHVAQEQAEAAVSTEGSHETTGAETVESQDVLNALASYMPTESRTEVVFVDPTVPNYQELLAGMDPNTEVIMLDAGKDGVQQIADSLAGRTGVDAIHLISHGNAGDLQLGTSHLTQESMTGQYANELATIRQSLSEQADILIYGCDFAEGDSGQAAVNRLAELTGADVEASNDLTGNAALGGDWDLEVKTGSIETRIAIDAHVQADWMGLLAAPTLDASKSPVLNLVAEDAGAPSGTVGTLVSSLVDFAAPAGQVDNVTDGDAGAQLGIAITAANMSHGTWWYTTNNGSTWSALGTVGEGSARLLAADANTRIYFQGNADYNGTMSDAITFRAWDQTSGTAGSTADLTGVATTVKDQFSSASYSNNNGTANWSGSWVETDSSGGGASGGRIQINSGQLDIRADAVNDGIYREANLSNATSATLSFSYNNALGSGDTIAVQVSSDGGAHYTTLTGGNFSNALHTGSGTVSFDITSAISANTRVRFLVTAENDNNHLYVDNVQISSSSSGTGGNTAFSGSTDTAALTVTSVNDAPTDLALSTNTVAENATNGTVVGTVSGTDPDSGDTKTYSFTDSAGGRFAINSSTGAITVADGSLLNYESATNHSVTVRVTDVGGLTYDETFTINLTNVNEAPTGADATVTISEDTSHTLTTANFGFSDVDAGDSLSAVRIDTLPGSGTLTLSGVAVTAGQVVTVANITAGNLVFTPAADANGTGYATLTFSVRDSNNAYDAAPNSLTVDVTAVNDAPTRTAGTVSNLTVSEDAGLASLGLGSVTYSPAGGADESGQTLTYAVTAIPSPSVGDVFLADGTTRVTVGSYTLADIHGMQFKPAANASGVTAFQFNVYDSGGTANGGADNISQFILITVNAVNDAPTITNLSGDSLSYSEGDGVVVIEQSGNALVADVDSTNLDTGTLTVSIPAGGDSAEDVLSIQNQGTGAGQIGVSGSNITYGGVTIGTFTGGSSGSNLVITLNSSATPTAVTALVKNITYENTDTNAPTTGARTVRYVLTDGDGGTSANYDTTVTVSGVNDAPTDLSSGIELNTDGGNDAYLISDTGLSQSLTATTVEIRFAANDTPFEPVFISFNNPAGDELSIQLDEPAKDLEIDFGAGNVALASAIDYRAALVDGAVHTLSVTWGSTAGDWSVYIDGVHIESGTGLSVGTALDTTNGRFVFGQEQDAQNSGYDSTQYFSGTIYDVRIWNDVRAAGEIAQYHQQQLDLTPVEAAAVGLVANWQMDGFDGSNQVVDIVSGNNLSVAHANGTGFTAGAVDSQLSIDENSPNGSHIGFVMAEHPDASETFSYSLTDSAGGRFAVNSSTGQITVADGTLLNYEAATSHTVTVRVTDSGGLTYDEALTINLTNVNEAPTGADATVTITEDTSHTLTTGNFGFSDVDAGDSLSEVRIDSLPSAGTLKLSGVTVTAGQVVSVANITAGNLVFTPADNANGTGYASFTFSVRDSNSTYDTAPNTLTLNVTAVNDAPTISSLTGDTQNYTEGAGAVIIEQGYDSWVQDVDSANFDTGTLTISIPSGGDSAEDVLSIRHQGTAGGQIGVSGSNVTYQGTTIGTFTGGTSGSPLVVTFNSNATVTAVDALVLNVTYRNTDTDSPTTGARTVRFALTDGDGGTSSNYDTTVTVSAVNDAPTDLALSANTVAENAANGTVVGTVSGTDVDAGDTKAYSLTDTAGGRFTINSSTGVITVADGSLLNYESATSHSVTVRVTDSGGLTYDEAFTINLTNVNEAPTGIDVTVTISEDASHALTLANFGFSDVDAGDSLSAVRIDSLPAAGSLTLSGVAVTVGQVVTVADITGGNLLFTPAADASGIGYTSLTFSVRDAGNLYDVAPNTLTIDVTPQNDAPALAANTGSTVAEGGSDTMTSGELSVIDVDNTAAQLTFSIGSGPASGRLELTTAPGVSATTFTQADIIANRLVYVHDGSETTSDSFTFTVNDGAGGTVGSTTVTLTITPVNDAPTIVSGGGGAIASVTVAENVTAITVVTGADVDVPAQTLTYGISGGADQALFTIDTATGALSFVAPPDFEVATDANGDNVYVVQVRVVDSQGAAVTQTIQVTVTDIAEGASPGPVTPLLPSSLIPTASPSLPLPAPAPSAPSPAAPGPPEAMLPGRSAPIPTVVPRSVQGPLAAPRDGTPTRPVFRPEGARSMEEASKAQVQARWDDMLGPGSFSIVPVEAVGARTSDEPESPDVVREVLMAKLDAMTTSLEQAIGADEEQHMLVAHAVALTGTTLSVGFVAWALRSSWLLASCMATLPAWKTFDPLPVVSLSRRDRARHQQDADASQLQEQAEFTGLEDLFGSTGPLKPKP